MSKLLRRAMEELRDDSTAQPATASGQDQTIVMKGPLAEVFAQALDVAYAKDKPQDTPDQPAMETQAMDAEIARQIVSQLVQADAAPATASTVYGVSESSVQENDVVNVTKELASAENPEKFVLVIDGTAPTTRSAQDTAPVERVEILRTALECLVEAHGGKVYRSLPDYVRSFA